MVDFSGEPVAKNYGRNILFLDNRGSPSSGQRQMASIKPLIHPRQRPISAKLVKDRNVIRAVDPFVAPTLGGWG